MSKLSESREPADRVRAALDHLENAQAEVLRAAEALSSIKGMASEHAATLKLYDRVRAHWYKIREASQRKEGKLSLDEMALRSCDQRDQAKPEGHDVIRCQNFLLDGSGTQCVRGLNHFDECRGAGDA